MEAEPRRLVAEDRDDHNDDHDFSCKSAQCWEMKYKMLISNTTNSVIFIFSPQIPDCAFHALLQLTEPARVHNSTHMAAHEMEEILDADYSTIQEHLSKFIFYYGSKDNWAPRSHYDSMRKRFPEGDIRLCRRGLQHAFCLESSELMADMVWNWVCPAIQEIDWPRSG